MEEGKQETVLQTPEIASASNETVSQEERTFSQAEVDAAIAAAKAEAQRHFQSVADREVGKWQSEATRHRNALEAAAKERDAYRQKYEETLTPEEKQAIQLQTIAERVERMSNPQPVSQAQATGGASDSTDVVAEMFYDAGLDPYALPDNLKVQGSRIAHYIARGKTEEAVNTAKAAIEAHRMKLVGTPAGTPNLPRDRTAPAGGTSQGGFQVKSTYTASEIDAIPRSVWRANPELRKAVEEAQRTGRVIQG